jgi:nuclear RNA export factor
MSRPYKKGKGGGGGSAATTKHNSPCKFFLRGSCSNQRCPYLHVRNQTAIRAAQHKDVAAQQSSGTVKVLSAMLKLFFEKQTRNIYDANLAMLNLSKLVAFDDLSTVASSINFNTRAFCVALCTCIRELVTPPPTILQVDQNNITSFHHFAKALEEAGLHTSLRALSLAGNDIKSSDIAQELKHFTNLSEVNLVGNPCTAADDYKGKFKKHVPWLLGLDGESLAAPPLQIPWPRFFDPSQMATVDIADPNGAAARRYDSTQNAILQFVQTSVLNPLEMEPTPGVLTGVDAVSDVYALNAAFSFTLVSNDAAVSTPSRTAGGGAASAQRDVVREIVGFRMRQTESNHNVLLGLKSTTVAMGRTSVCAKLEHVLYPKNFVVGHYIHDSPDVAVLDNRGFGPNAVVGMKQPLSVVTLHGVMLWRYRTAGPDADRQNSALLRDAIVIKRNFSRVLTVSATEPGRWRVVNDMVTLYPFRGSADDVDEQPADGSAASPSAAVQMAASLTPQNVLFRDVHPYDVVFMPAADPRRAARLGRSYRVPTPVVETLSSMVNSDSELVAFLVDLGDVPLETYEHCAVMVDMDPLASIFLCRIGNRLGIEPSEGAALLRKCGLDWPAILQAVGR